MPQLKKQIFILEKDGNNAQKTIEIERNGVDSIKLGVSIKGKPIIKKYLNGADKD